MHSLKDTQFWLCYFLFIVPMLKNDLKLCVNHQFIAPSLYNQITQLIFITDIFRPKIKCRTLFGGLLCLCEVSRLGLERGRETIFGGLPCRRFLSPRVSPSRAPVFSWTRWRCHQYFGHWTTLFCLFCISLLVNLQGRTQEYLLAREILLCEQRRTYHKRVTKTNYIFEYPWNLV